MQLIRINGELAEIVPTVPGAQLVYLACEPEDRLPREIQYAPLGLHHRFRRGRLTLIDDGRVLLVQRLEPDLLEGFNPRKLIRQLLVKPASSDIRVSKRKRD